MSEKISGDKRIAHFITKCGDSRWYCYENERLLGETPSEEVALAFLENLEVELWT